MLWINLQTTFLRAPEFAAARPTERATWLCLLGHCVEQENGGRLAGAAHWDERRWRQLGVTRREVRTARLLLRHDGDDVGVRFYPLDKQAEVQRLRAMGAAVGPRRPADPGRMAGQPAAGEPGRPAGDIGEQFTKRRWSPPPSRPDFPPPPAPPAHPAGSGAGPVLGTDAGSAAERNPGSAEGAGWPAGGAWSVPGSTGCERPPGPPTAGAVGSGSQTPPGSPADGGPALRPGPDFTVLTRAGARHTATTGEEWRRVVDRFGIARVCAMVRAMPSARERWPGRVEEALEQQDQQQAESAPDHLLTQVAAVIARDGWQRCRACVGFPPATVTNADDLRDAFAHNRAAARLLLHRSAHAAGPPGTGAWAASRTATGGSSAAKAVPGARGGVDPGDGRNRAVPPTPGNHPPACSAPPAAGNHPISRSAPTKTNHPGSHDEAPTKTNQPGSRSAPTKTNQPGSRSAPTKTNQPGSRSAPTKTNQPGSRNAPTKTNQPDSHGAPATGNQPGSRSAPTKTNHPDSRSAPTKTNHPIGGKQRAPGARAATAPAAKRIAPVGQARPASARAGAFARMSARAAAP